LFPVLHFYFCFPSSARFLRRTFVFTSLDPHAYKTPPGLVKGQAIISFSSFFPHMLLSLFLSQSDSPTTNGARMSSLVLLVSCLSHLCFLSRLLTLVTARPIAANVRAILPVSLSPLAAFSRQDPRPASTIYRVAMRSSIQYRQWHTAPFSVLSTCVRIPPGCGPVSLSFRTHG
jgi:hypothetical protein